MHVQTYQKKRQEKLPNKPENQLMQTRDNEQQIKRRNRLNGNLKTKKHCTGHSRSSFSMSNYDRVYESLQTKKNGYNNQQS